MRHHTNVMPSAKHAFSLYWLDSSDPGSSIGMFLVVLVFTGLLHVQVTFVAEHRHVSRSFGFHQIIACASHICCWVPTC